MKRNVLWNTAGSVFYCVCQWLITVIVVRLSSYENAGYLSLAMTTSSSFSTISLFSMRNFQVSDVKGEYNNDVYVGSRILTCFFALVCCTLTILRGNSCYQIICIEAFMVVRIAEAIVDVMHGIDQKYDHYDFIGKSYIIRGIITVCSFTFTQVVLGDLAITLCVMALLNCMAAFLFDWKKTYNLDFFRPLVLDKKVWELLGKCFPIVIFSFLLSVENLLPKTILQQQYGAEELGIYSSIASPTLIVQVFSAVVFNPFLPALSELYYRGEIKRFRKMLHRTFLLLIGMCVIVNIGAAILGRFGLTLLFGRGILEYYDLFFPIVWCTILIAIIWIVSAVLVALRQIRWLLTGMIFDFLICVSLARRLIECYGKNGVSFVQIIVYLAYIIFMVIICEMVLYKQEKKCREEKS